ncbi:uroporphyrinogen-III C-methyltransferase [Caldivirga sp. UBA161]|uniref:uroporphyrinogen-III C-methyltransferase n=1 Tax=Caldivirga sp. UBA161 TaxID=1915569 RepID=UPI0025B909B8|nr:uroporphyrinogen-III C-methyltransferase [Caldivirga sp. UBA161]
MVKVYIVGAGPGDPELITVKAVKLLELADVVVYDRLIPVDVLKHVKEGAELIYVGKEPGRHSMEQDEINELLLRKALEGKVIVRLHGGDPFIFGRGFEECQYLIRNGVECEAVPGVTSAIAAPEQYLIPILLRGVSSSVAFVTGREDPGKGFREVDFRRLATSVGTIVILMGASEACRIAGELIQGGLDSSTPVAVVTRAYMSGSRVQFMTLGEVAGCRITVENPSVIIVGKSVRLSPLYKDAVSHST